MGLRQHGTSWVRQAIRADTHGFIDRNAPRYEFLQRFESDAHL